MKLYKIFAIALAALTMTACSDDDDKTVWNSNSDVTVEFAEPSKPTFEYKEGRGIVDVPLVVNGVANGNIMVTVACVESGLNPAQEDVHYFVTSKSVIIAPDNQTASIEMNVVDADQDINDPRTFEIRIVDVKGAGVGSRTFAPVTIKDNDNDFYDLMSGAWTVNYIDYDGKPGSASVTLTAADEDDPAYNNYYMMTGLQRQCTFQVDYKFDPVTMEGSFEIPYSQQIGTVTFTGYGALPVLFMGLTDDGYLIQSGAAVGDWSEDRRSVEFAAKPYVGYFPITSDGKALLWDAITILSFTR